MKIRNDRWQWLRFATLGMAVLLLGAAPAGTTSSSKPASPRSSRRRGDWDASITASLQKESGDRSGPR